MKFFTRTYKYEHDWGTVTSAFWIKYPNDRLKHVESVHTLNQSYNEKTEELHTRRMMILQYALPDWVKKLTGISGEGVAIEETICNRKEKRLTLISRNITLSKIFQVYEVCSYEPDPDNPDHTIYKQEAQYRVFGFGALGGSIEKAACSGAESKAHLGQSTVQELIESKILPLNEGKTGYIVQAKNSLDEKLESLKLHIVDMEASAGVSSCLDEIQARVSTACRGLAEGLEDSVLGAINHAEVAVDRIYKDVRSGSLCSSKLVQKTESIWEKIAKIWHLPCSPTPTEVFQPVHGRQ